MSTVIARLQREGARAYIADFDVSQQLMAALERVSNHPQRIGWNCVEFRLPTAFPRAPDPALARLLVHSGLVGALRQRGFEVRLTGDEEAPTLLIGWESAISSDNLERLQRQLDTLRVGENEAAEFRARGAVRPKPRAAGLPSSAPVESPGGRPDGPPVAGLPRGLLARTTRR